MSMMFRVHTALTASALAFLQIYLMMSVGLTRLKTGIGDGGRLPAVVQRGWFNLVERA